MRKISVSLSGHQTSISLEQEFFELLQRFANEQKTSVASIIQQIDSGRKPGSNLSSETRIWILKQILKTSK